MSPTEAPSPATLRARLGDVSLADARRLRRRLDRARRGRDAQRRAAALATLEAEITAAERRLAVRKEGLPEVTYPAELPVAAARTELLAALEAHQVVVVAGETGSGKTTQLPKLCLELGRGIRGMIGHTQPRRIAARSVAARIADELAVPLGAQVGFQVRFADQVSEGTLVKVMTDGILLAEIQRDPTLSAYDTIIIDEAHERSLNIDFLLGYLAQLLPRRPDLKLVITSATIDPERFAAHFDDAPVVEVSGRTYPVEVRYRPIADLLAGADDGDDDQIAAICAAVGELTAEVTGDLLVFLSGEREIRDTADALRALHLPDTEVLPLYARLSTADQQRVFAPHSGRRIVLATNVAETSLTVPGIHAVIDPGFARISRYSNRTKVQRLPIEKISQASADQRAGRCGRVAEGVCIRLYDEDDFLRRPEFTDPEILRTNLASVILQMTALGLGDVAAFPFLDPPDQRAVRDAEQLLVELGAVTFDPDGGPRRLTEVGRQLAKLPVDPRIARMVVEGGRNGCLHEVLVVAAALSIQDPRERPADAEHEADELHARFADPTSDFLALVNLWRYLRDLQHELGSSAFRRRCRAEHLHFLRVREWQDVYAQLWSVARELGLRRNSDPADPDAVHRAVLAGLLSLIGLKQGESKDFLGARGAKFRLWPGSALAKTPPAWVVVGELVETSRLWGRTAARIDPAWVEGLAGHLLTRTYSAPRWSRKRGAVIASERVTLYGIPLVTDRTVPYGRIDPETSRMLFIREALVEGRWASAHGFLGANRQTLSELSELEHRTRRRDLVVDDDALVELYDARIPQGITSTRHFDRWWKQERRRRPDLLTFTRVELLAKAGPHIDDRAFPGAWRQGDLELDVSYRFAPGDPFDGVTVHIPVAVLGRVAPVGFDWQVPGFREELVTALVRSLPKELRRRLVPVPDVVRAVLPRLEPPTAEPLAVALARVLHAERGVAIPPDALVADRVEDHLRITFRVVDGTRTVAAGKELGVLQRQLAGDVRAAVAASTSLQETSGLTAWTVGTIARSVTGERDGQRVVGYPALVDEGSTVGLRVLLSASQQQQAMWRGTRRLLLLSLPPVVRSVHTRLSNADKLALTRWPFGDVGALLDDIGLTAIDALMREHGAPAWDEVAWRQLRGAVGAEVGDRVVALVGDVLAAIHAAQEVLERLDAVRAGALAQTASEVRAHVETLLRPGFVLATGERRLADLERYLRADAHRLDKLGGDRRRDHERALRLAEVEQAYAALLRRPGAAGSLAVWDIRWMIEELRVSLFAQHLGTRVRVSEERIYRAIADA